MKRILSLVLAFVLMLSTASFTSVVWAGERNIRVGSSKQADFPTIGEALDSITFRTSETSPVYIHIEPGTYTEELTITKPYITFDNTDTAGRGKVKIAYDKASVHEDDPSKSKGTQGSATVTVTAEAHDFTAKGITFENTYNLDQPDLGSDGGRAQSQAVAVVTLTDRVIFDSCSFIGRQDTLYLKGASKGADVYGSCNEVRVYLKDCYIEGTIDYIFGDATAVFENCNLNMAYYKNGGHYTAANTTLFNIGYVFTNCTLTADESLKNTTANVDLGRPWQADSAYPNYGSQTVFINCSMDDRIEDYGFSLWSDATVSNKIRYYEYGSKDLSGNPLDLSKRADYVKILTDEQAAAYTPENILLGSDGWNPRGLLERDMPAEIKAADVTLNTYQTELPVYSTLSLKAYVLPNTAANKAVTYTSSNESTATVDSEGNVYGVKKGSCIITAETEDGSFTASAYIDVTSAETNTPILKEMSLNKDDNIYPGDTLVVDYSFVLNSDNNIDNSLIKWYSGGQIVKQGDKDYAGYYIVQNDDIGNSIKVQVLPRTTTSYAAFGTAGSLGTNSVLQPLYEVAPTYIHEEFEDLNIPFAAADGSALETDFAIYSGEDYSAIGSNTSDEAQIISNEKIDGAFTLSARMRFNPDKTGLSSSDSFDFITNYDPENKNWYRFNLVKGDDSNSVKLYLYEAAKGKETLIGSNETSAAGAVAQNSGEDNPYFTICAVVSDTRVKYTLTLQGATSSLAKIIVDKDEVLPGGYVGIKTSGKAGVVLVDNIIVTGKSDSTKVYDDSKTQIFLAGDSTVKTYGITRSTGGWGEYLQEYFDSDKVEIVNKAEGGRSSRSFINQGRLDEISEEISEGDYLFIQFGHNDCSDDEAYLTERYCPLGEPDENGIYPVTAGKMTRTPDELLALDTEYMYSGLYYSYDCGGTYKWYLKKYIDEARAKGAIPVLVTPVTRMYFGEDGKIYAHHDDSTTTDNAYVTAMKQLGEEENVVVLDMFGKTESYYNSIGENEASLLHDVKADGKIDKTHHSKYGAFTIAGMVRELIDSSSLEIKAYTKNPDEEISSDTGLRKATAFILGDSTACNYETDATHSIVRGGWGMYLSDYMADSLEIKNLAISGRSSKSFTTEDNYQIFLNDVQKGDYVFIQFGHNDQKNSTEEDAAKRYTDAAGSKETTDSFKYYLYNYYIKPAQDAGAIPLLLSPVSIRDYSNGKTTDSHGIYDDAVRELAAETGVSFIDMTKITADLYDAMGEAGSEKLFAYYTDTEKGLDTVHFNHFGGYTIAGYVAGALMSDESTLKNYIVDNYDSVYTTRGEFVTDLMTLIGRTGAPEDNFADVDPGKSYANGVGNAKAMGIVSGDSNGNFNPEAPITRQDMFVMTYNLLTALEYDLYTDTDYVSGFADSDYVASYAEKPLNGLIENGIISGTKGGNLNPAAYAEKGQSASVLNELYKLIYLQQ
ncbi:MAG: pectinesterase family protein [Clostridiales bacterium]|nr:pectinesterase family protein [Clostridiales bacterium]